MIQFLTGDLFQSNADALVNTVNTEGVMGKGIALQVKRRFPKVFQAYQAAVKRGEIQVGKVQVVPTEEFSPRFIINFPTKTSWRKPSSLDFIKETLPSLVAAVIQYGIKSIAIPPLGAGNGGLDWKQVRPQIEQAFAPLHGQIDVLVYEPTVMQFEATVPNSNWTPAQLQIASALFTYRSIGDSLTLVEIQKLAYFLERAGTGMNLQYKVYVYGPYSEKLRHVILGLEGKLITGLNAGKAKPTDELDLNYTAFAEVEEKLQLQSDTEKEPWLVVKELIHGWESPYALELLATVDWCMQINANLNERNLADAVRYWGGPENMGWGKRKASIMKEEHLQLAFTHLKRFQPLLAHKLAV